MIADPTQQTPDSPTWHAATGAVALIAAILARVVRFGS
jgi:hypothetical protein